MSGPPCTPAGGSYLLIPRRGSGVGVVCWTSEARDSAGRRLSLSRTEELNFFAILGSPLDRRFSKIVTMVLLGNFETQGLPQSTLK